MNNLPKVIEPVGLDDLRKVVGDDFSPGARKELDDYELVNPKRKVMM